MDVLLSAIKGARAYRDWMTYIREEGIRDVGETEELRRAILEGEVTEESVEVYKESLLWDAPYDFDSYMLYMEIEREPEARFYEPRRRTLQRYGVVEALQKLADGKIQELFISLPPRVGKTTLLMFYTTWLIGRNSENSNLYSAYSDTITKAFYNGVMEVILDRYTYNWSKVFPGSAIVQTNSQDEILNVDRRKRYASLTCRSLYGTLNGACDCNGVLMSDDLIGGIEEALSKDRLRSAWLKVENNLIPRAKEGAKLLWCGTRWSIADPAGARMDVLKYTERDDYVVINVPALDSRDESNFEYGYGVGFSTEFYRARRLSFERNNDTASWLAQYMGEPVERSGMLFEPEDFRTYNGVLPEGEPDRKFFAADPAYGGGDYTAGVVCLQYGEDIYIPDVVYSAGDKKITQPLIANMIDKWEIRDNQFEGNKTTEGYRDGVQALLKTRTSIVQKPAGNQKSKEQRIYECAPDIRERMIFLSEDKRSRDYAQFMSNVYSFTLTGKNAHDDAPDVLAMAARMVSARSERVKIFSRPF